MWLVCCNKLLAIMTSDHPQTLLDWKLMNLKHVALAFLQAVYAIEWMFMLVLLRDPTCSPGPNQWRTGSFEELTWMVIDGHV